MTILLSCNDIIVVDENTANVYPKKNSLQRRSESNCPFIKITTQKHKFDIENIEALAEDAYVKKLIVKYGHTSNGNKFYTISSVPCLWRHSIGTIITYYESKLNSKSIVKSSTLGTQQSHYRCIEIRTKRQLVT